VRALVIGAGSIGERHAAILAELGYSVASVSARTDLDRPTYADIPGALLDFDPAYIVVANETGKHAASIAELKSSDFHGSLLVEKPLAVPRETFDATAFSRVGVGFNLRFHPVLVRLRELLSGETVHTVEAYAGQDLATWRPGRSLESQYSSSRAQGGGVLRDLSHELDYLRWIFGECDGLFALGGRVAEKTVDSDDAWGLVARFAGAPIVTLQLNYFDTHTRRRVVVNSTAGTIEADLIAGTVRRSAVVETFELETNATYRAQHLAMADDAPTQVASVDDALRTDELVAMIEESATTMKWIERR